jgi:hypothetical protein
MDLIIYNYVWGRFLLSVYAIAQVSEFNRAWVLPSLDFVELERNTWKNGRDVETGS